MTRDELHLRHIEMRGFRRSDGLFEVEGRVADRKPYPFTSPGDGRNVLAHSPIHDMGVRLVFDEDFLVHDVQTFTDSSPYEACPEGGRALQAVKGLRMTKGWNREVRARLRGPASCTHLMELLGPMATTAFQTLSVLRLEQPDELDANGRPAKIDSCYAYSAGGQVVLRRWPQFHTAPEERK